jgi:lipopolysaccharide export system protein LptA
MAFFSSTRGRAVVVVAAVLVAAGTSGFGAQQHPPQHPPPPQQSSGPPNALQGFSQNRDKPIKINAETLDVRNKEKMATFSGDVHLVQGEVDMRSKTLVVFYDDPPPPAQPAPSKGGKPSAVSDQLPPPQQQNQQSQQIKRVEARGDVVVKQKDQTATGELGIFDMRANTVEMTGNVFISQGQNTLKGDNLTVNMTTGESLLTCGKIREKCRVTALVNSGTIKPEGQAGPAATREAPRPHPAQP